VPGALDDVVTLQKSKKDASINQVIRPGSHRKIKICRDTYNCEKHDPPPPCISAARLSFEAFAAVSIAQTNGPDEDQIAAQFGLSRLILVRRRSQARQRVPPNLMGVFGKGKFYA